MIAYAHGFSHHTSADAELNSDGFSGAVVHQFLRILIHVNVSAVNSDLLMFVATLLLALQ